MWWPFQPDLRGEHLYEQPTSDHDAAGANLRFGPPEILVSSYSTVRFTVVDCTTAPPVAVTVTV
jgi:hypothetical protein